MNILSDEYGLIMMLYERVKTLEEKVYPKKESQQELNKC
jgi:hypothetical protein